MARFILVLGDSGSGKTTAWRNIPSNEAFILSPNTKPLSFIGHKKMYQPFDSGTGQGNIIKGDELTSIPKSITYLNSAPHIKYILVEDFTHFMNACTLGEAFRKKATGDNAFKRWEDFGCAIRDILCGPYVQSLRDDLTIVINHHTETDMWAA